MADWLEVDLALWGKSRGLQGRRYPLVCHLIDAAAAMGALWDEYLPPGVRAVIADGLGASQEHARVLLMYWAAMHDIGKIMACFQAQDEVGFEQLVGYPEGAGEPKGHAFAVHVWLGRTLAEAGYKSTGMRSPGLRVAQLLGGHHGRFSPFNQAEILAPLECLPALGGGRWEEQRRIVAKEWTVAVTPAVLATASDPQIARAISEMRQTAERMERHLERALRNAWIAINDPSNGSGLPQRKDISKGPWPAQGAFRYWGAAERIFWSRVRRRDLDGAADEFLRLALEVYDQVTDSAGTLPRAKRAIELKRGYIFAARGAAPVLGAAKESA